jgi:hypothetical protein
MTFNTFLMLPAMMFVQNPYKDHGDNVRTSYVKLGSQGKKDYYAGVVLLLMVIKKTLNCYLIFRWMSEANDKADDVAQYISMGLLFTHFIVAMYIMMVCCRCCCCCCCCCIRKASQLPSLHRCDVVALSANFIHEMRKWRRCRSLQRAKAAR